MIDFANSYMTWFGAAGGSISRIDIEAACTLVDGTGGEDSFYLIAPCRAEHTHSDGQLIVMPNYDFRGIFGASEYRIIRTHWVSEPDYLGDPGLETTGGRVLDESGLHGGKWDEVRLDVPRLDRFIELEDNQSVVDATLENRALVSRTELEDEASGVRAVLEYPVKTMNVLRSPVRFQIDTGPIIVPDFASEAELAVARLDLAHVVYNLFDGGELILRKPVAVGGGDDGIDVTDYSERVEYTGRNTVLAST